MCGVFKVPSALQSPARAESFTVDMFITKVHFLALKITTLWQKKNNCKAKEKYKNMYTYKITRHDNDLGVLLLTLFLPPLTSTAFLVPDIAGDISQVQSWAMLW